MKILFINSVCGVGSTGKIMTSLMGMAKDAGYVVKAVCSSVEPIKGVESNDVIVVGSKLDYYAHNVASRITDHEGLYSKNATRLLIKKIKEFHPNIVHIHNIHGHWINYQILFEFLKTSNIKVVWTLHDCWAFTGHCAHFDMCKCEQWKSHCLVCKSLRDYPQCYFKGDVYNNYEMKQKSFTSLSYLIIVTPSQWLADLVKVSFMKKYTVKVINNGIDLNVFCQYQSDIRLKYHLENKYVILGVAFGWGMRKGLDIFIELSRRLDDRFKIMLVGTDDNIDKQLPKNIISIHRTNNQQELAKIYSAADLFVNPTREDTYPTVNMEAIACGTPVLTFRTGGSPEIPDNQTGCVVSVDDIDEMERQIIRICTENIYKRENCVNRAKFFDANLKFREYIDLYDKLASDGGLA